ncbi:HD domain-containing phosphohydrolase [Acidobacteriota bacterium]
MHSILLISRDHSITQMLEILLAQHSFMVHRSKTFNEALDELKRRGHYDMVLSLEERTKQSAADLRRLVSKIAPYARFANLSCFGVQADDAPASCLSPETAMESCEVMNIIEEVLRISMELKSKPRKPTDEELKTSLYNTVYLLSSVLNYHGVMYGRRSHDIMYHAVELCRRLGFPQPIQDEIAFSALLKDIGMIKVDPGIKQQPRKLNPEEFEALKKHCVHGVNIIMKVKLPWDLKDNILCHHERFDGKGYPLGLQKYEIPIGARIVSAVDAYFSMMSDRPHRKALPQHEALQEIEKNLGTQFDPVIGEELIKLIQPEGHKANPSTSGSGRIAVIDHDEHSREQIVQQAGKLGYSAFGVEGGFAALEYLNVNKIDLILCDLDMPGVDGFQLLHWIKQLPDLEGIPFILMSAKKRETSDVVTGLEMGADDYLLKPFTDHHLKSRIDTVLEKRGSTLQKELSTGGKESDVSMAFVKKLLKHRDDNATGELKVRVKSGTEGRIFFIKGQVRHAVYFDLEGEEAFFALLADEPGASELEDGTIPPQITVTSGLEYLLIEGLRRTDEPTEDIEFELAM